MKIERATEVHVAHVAARLREADVAEFLPLYAVDTQAELADALVARFKDTPDTYAFLSDEPVAIGAMVMHRPNVATLAFFSTDRFDEIALPVARWVKRTLFPAYEAEGVHRIDAVSIDGHAKAHKWIRMCGLEPESGPLRGYGKGGETYFIFSRVRADVRSAAA